VIAFDFDVERDTVAGKRVSLSICAESDAISSVLVDDVDLEASNVVPQVSMLYQIPKAR
jgi:hypothetical protein